MFLNGPSKKEKKATCCTPLHLISWGGMCDRRDIYSLSCLELDAGKLKYGLEEKASRLPFHENRIAINLGLVIGKHDDELAAVLCGRL